MATRGPEATRQSAEHPDRSAASGQTARTQTGISVRAVSAGRERDADARERVVNPNFLRIPP